MEGLYVESKAWTVSIEPSDGKLEAPLKNLQASNFRPEPANFCGVFFYYIVVISCF